MCQSPLEGASLWSLLTWGVCTSPCGLQRVPSGLQGIQTEARPLPSPLAVLGRAVPTDLAVPVDCATPVALTWVSGPVTTCVPVFMIRDLSGHTAKTNISEWKSNPVFF